MIRKMRSEDKKTYMEMAREFYHSDAVLHPVPDTYFERTADEAFRSKGIGREFFAYLDKVKGSAVTRMRLEVEEDNTRAVALYKKLGYKPLEYAQMIKDAPLK